MTRKSATTSRIPQANEGEIEQPVNYFHSHSKGMESLLGTKGIVFCSGHDALPFCEKYNRGV